MKSRPLLRLSAAATLALGLSMAPAAATTVTVDQPWGQGYATADLHYGGDTSNEVVAGFRLSYNGQTYAAFCMELDQGTNTTTNYTLSAYTQDSISRVMAAAGFNGTDWRNDSVDTADEETALQLAIWEVIYDGLSASSLGSGNFWVSNVSSQNVLGLANSYLTLAKSYSASDYRTDTLVRYAAEWQQDMVSSTRSSAATTTTTTASAVPEPSQALLLGVSLLPVIAAARRRATRTAARPAC